MVVLRQYFSMRVATKVTNSLSRHVIAVDSLALGIGILRSSRDMRNRPSASCAIAMASSRESPSVKHPLRSGNETV